MMSENFYLYGVHFPGKITPALHFIERAAAALEVSVAELLGSQPNASRSKPGPQSQLQRKFEQVKLLPREKQKFVLQFLDTVLENNQQKA